MLNTVTPVQQWKNWPLLFVLCRPLSYIRHCIEATQWLHQVLGSYPNIISLTLVSCHWLWVEFTQNQSGTEFYWITRWTAILSLALPGLAIMDIQYFGQLSFPGHSLPEWSCDILPVTSSGFDFAKIFLVHFDKISLVHYDKIFLVHFENRNVVLKLRMEQCNDISGLSQTWKAEEGWKCFSSIGKS